MEHYTSTSGYTQANETDNEDYSDIDKDLEFLEHEFQHYRNIYVFIVQYFITMTLVLETLAVIGSTSFISFLIYKFKRLRTKTNYILLNLLISSSIFIITILANCILDTYTEYFPEESPNLKYVYFIIIIASLASINAIVLFVLLLAIDWLILTNYSNVLAKYQQWYHHIIIGIYTFSCKDCLLFWVFKRGHALTYISFEIYCTLILFIISAITVCVFYVIKKRTQFSPEQSKTEYALAISCTFFLMWLPMVITLVGAIIISFLTRLGYKYSVILTLIIFILGIVASAAPLVYVSLLGRLDTNFRAAYEHILRKAVRNYTQHDCNEELLEGV